ncbi:hypothetical protein H5410_053130 [Solanum commersonii]|uniref:Uncharacterized protein n=1 Tax=Solanum commersonii TaxID=4109 RepID=A0A9J5X428_SOLCO|nr:hypothetical protein H5410_053130 [Solanum commersonii]
MRRWFNGERELTQLGSTWFPWLQILTNRQSHSSSSIVTERTNMALPALTFHFFAASTSIGGVVSDPPMISHNSWPRKLLLKSQRFLANTSSSASLLGLYSLQSEKYFPVTPFKLGWRAT